MNISSDACVAVIGAGYWGTILINTLYKLNINNIYIYDLKNKNLRIIKKRFPKIIIAQSYSKLLHNKKITSFLFATPPEMNLKLCKNAIKFNKNIFIEKPVVKNLNQLIKLKKMLYKKKLVFMTGYIYCYNDYINCIKKIIKQKKLGKIKYINFIRKNFGPVRKMVSSDLDLSSHDVSILLYIFGKVMKKIHSCNHSILKKNINDISNLSYKLGSLKIDINSSWLYPEKIRTITIIGSKKMLLFDELNIKSPIKIFSKYAEYPKINFFSEKHFSKKVKMYQGKSSEIKLKTKPPLINEIEHFFECIKFNLKPITSINFAEKVIKIIN